MICLFYCHSLIQLEFELSSSYMHDVIIILITNRIYVYIFLYFLEFSNMIYLIQPSLVAQW